MCFLVNKLYYLIMCISCSAPTIVAQQFAPVQQKRDKLASKFSTDFGYDMTGPSEPQTAAGAVCSTHGECEPRPIQSCNLGRIQGGR